MSKVRIGIVGCGSVSGPYLADLSQHPRVELVSVCDVIAERAQARAWECHLSHWYDDVDRMLSGADFDMLVNLTPMREHFAINYKALQAGKHVLSEKPLATSREEGRLLLETAAAHGVQLYGAPAVVTSPAFRCLAEVIGSGEIGRVCAAWGRYGHTGPGWGPWFYRQGGGALFDLGVYNITTLTGLLGPARSVVALSGTVIPERLVEGQRVRVEAEDNIMLLMDHGEAVFSSVQTGFVYGPRRQERTLELIGTRGSANLLGWDWHPRGVEIWREDRQEWEVMEQDQQGYSWERGASYLVDCFTTGKTPLITGEHAFHVLDVMLAAHESAAHGRKIEVTSTFPWPLFPAQAALPLVDPSLRGLDPEDHNR